MEKHIRDFTSFKNKRRNTEVSTDVVNESVIQMGDKYRIMNGIDVSQSLVNAVAKKVKEETGKKLSNIYSDTQVAEEIVKYIANEFLKIESIPVSIFVGGDEQTDETDTTEDTVVADTTTEPTAEETAPAADTTAPADDTTVAAPVATEDTKEEPKFEEPKKEDTELPL